MQRKNNSLKTIFLVAALIGLAGAWWYVSPAQEAKRDDAAAIALMQAFGAGLQKAELTKEGAELAAEITDSYAAYVTDDLLTTWIAQPSRAPGKLTENPYPSGIEIASITAQGKGRVVTGTIELATTDGDHGGSAGEIPFVAQLIPTDEGWKIAVFEQQMQ